jgi:mRNA interferase MazF
MTSILPGEFWVAEIPFTDGSASKRRPVLILWRDGLDLVVAAVTSASSRSATDVALADWRAAGLRVPSTVRLSRLDCLEQSLLLFRLGRVSRPDARQLRQVWRKDVRPQF